MGRLPVSLSRWAAGWICLFAPAVCPAAVFAWTAPGPVRTTSEDSLDPRLSVDAQGKAHVVWRERISGGLFHVWYSSNTDGLGFADPVTVSQGGSTGGGSPVVCANGNDVHVAWLASIGDNYEIWYRRRAGTIWGPILNASNTSIKSLRPAIAVRGSFGPVVAWDEAIYADDNYDTFFSEWAGSAFSPAANISNTAGGAVYGSVNVNVAVAPNGDVTAVWVDRISGAYHVNARRRVGGSWQARQELSTLETGPATPGITATADNRVHVVYEAQGTIWYHVHDGSSWSGPVALPGGLNSGIRPRLAVDDNGVIHVVADAFTDAQNNRDIFHSQGLPGSFAGWSNLSNTPGTASLNAEIGYGAGTFTVTWQENSNGQGGTGVYNTWYSLLSVSTGAPDPVTDFEAAAGNTAVTLSWTNPASANLVGTLIRGRTDGYPGGPDDGVLIADRPAAPGTIDTVTHAGLFNGTSWYYAAFAYTGTAERSYAEGVPATATPFGPGDFDHDGDVDQADFGRFQLCLSGEFTPQTAPSCTQARLDGDEDVDVDDTLRFIGCISGPGVPASPFCNS